MSEPGLAESIRRVVGGETLSAGAMGEAMETVLAGRASATQIGALAVALRMRGETAEELAAAAMVLRRHAAPLSGEALREGSRPLLDTCGTGGDGAGTFNISTAGALVVAACDVRVAKHGNRAVSSKCGSADVIEALGVAVSGGPDGAARAIREVGIAFLFAPAFHGALRHAAPVRRELGLRTFFNLLGPLANPAGASHQLLGVYDPLRVRQIAEVLLALSVEGAWVVHGEGGLDEVSPSGPTAVAVLRDGAVTERTVDPRTFGLEPVPLEALEGGDARRNAAIVCGVLAGEAGAPRVAVVINAAAGLLAAGVEDDPVSAKERVVEAVDSGRARALLDRWRRLAPHAAGGA